MCLLTYDAKINVIEKDVLKIETYVCILMMYRLRIDTQKKKKDHQMNYGAMDSGANTN